MIMRYTWVVLFMLGVGMLTGCGPIYQTKYDYMPPRSSTGMMCVAQCQQGKSTCEQMCQLRNDNCRTQARQDAIYRYEIYKQARQDRGRAPKKEVGDFDSSNSCNIPCRCESSFRACYAACGGQVLEQQVCVAFCDKH
jgi:hypothetical protein